MAKTPATKKHIVQAVVTSTLTSEGQSHSGAQFSKGEVDMNTEITEQDNTSDDNEIISEAEHESVFDLKSSRIYDTKDGNTMGTNPSLFDTLTNAKGVAVKMMIDDWKQEWIQNEQAASLQLVNLILRSSNVPPADRWRRRIQRLSCQPSRITSPIPQRHMH